MERMEIKTGKNGRGSPFFLSSDGVQWIVDRGLIKVVSAKGVESVRAKSPHCFISLDQALMFIAKVTMMEQDYATLADIRREILRLEEFFAEKLTVKV